MKYGLILSTLLFFPFWGNGQSGLFVFSEYKPLKAKPIRVFYHIPKGNTVYMPILMAFHGDERDAESYRNDWVEASDKYGFIVVAPEFSEVQFPGSTFYNTGNLFQDGDDPTSGRNPDSIWTFALVEPVFQYAKLFTGSQSTGYVAFGHSAGAQFLHRFTLFSSSQNMHQAICANAGWYTVPDSGITFPYGLDKSPVSTEELQKAFQKNLLILLGKQDVNPNSAGLRHTPEADAQGSNRLARGRFFYSESRKQAATLGTDFTWRLAEVEGVGHDHTLMAKNAVSLVVQAFEDQNPFFNPEQNVRITTQGLVVSGLQPNTPFKLSLFSPEGKLLQENHSNYADGVCIALQNRISGVYIVRLESAQGSKTQKIWAVNP